MLHCLVVESLASKLNVQIRGSDRFCEKIHNDVFWGEYIPNAVIVQGYDERCETWLVIESAQCAVDELAKQAYVDERHIKQLIVIIEAELEKLRQANQQYTMHGTVLALGGNAVLCIGNLSGIGKTSVGAYAADHGWRWMCDEKFTIFEGQVIGATTGILHDSKTKRAAGVRRPIADWQESVRARVMCTPIVTSENAVTHFELSYEKKLWILYEELTRDIRQTTGLLDGFVAPLASFDDNQLMCRRAEVSRRLAGQLRGYYIRGSAESMCELLRTVIAQDH